MALLSKQHIHRGTAYHFQKMILIEALSHAAVAMSHTYLNKRYVVARH